MPPPLLRDKPISFGGGGDMLVPPNGFLGLKPLLQNCAQFVLLVLQGFRICALFPTSPLLKQVWGAGDILVPSKGILRLKPLLKNCAQFVLIVLQGFRICVPFPNSLLLK